MAGSIGRHMAEDYWVVRSARVKKIYAAPRLEGTSLKLLLPAVESFANCSDATYWLLANRWDLILALRFRLDP